MAGRITFRMDLLHETDTGSPFAIADLSDGIIIPCVGERRTGKIQQSINYHATDAELLNLGDLSDTGVFFLRNLSDNASISLRLSPTGANFARYLPREGWPFRLPLGLLTGVYAISNGGDSGTAAAVAEISALSP